MCSSSEINFANFTNNEYDNNLMPLEILNDILFSTISDEKSSDIHNEDLPLPKFDIQAMYGQDHEV